MNGCGPEPPETYMRDGDLAGIVGILKEFTLNVHRYTLESYSVMNRSEARSCIVGDRLINESIDDGFGGSWLVETSDQSKRRIFWIDFFGRKRFFGGLDPSVLGPSVRGWHESEARELEPSTANMGARFWRPAWKWVLLTSLPHRMSLILGSCHVYLPMWDVVV